MRPFLASSLLVPLLLGASPLCAAETITIELSDHVADGSFIKPYSNRWKLVGVAPDKSVIEMGTWSDTLTIGDYHGRPVIKRRQAWVHDRGTEAYTNFVEQKSLAPILSQYVNTAGLYYRYEYADDHAHMRYQRSPQLPSEPNTPFVISAPMEQAEVQLPRPLFDFNTGMFGLLIAGFPLKEGYAARFPVMNVIEPKKSPVWIDFHVTGRETVPAGPGKQLETWRVIVNSPATEEVMRFNIAKEPPYIIRLQQEWAGRDWTFEML